MKILTIESTCDETAAAVITDQFDVLSSIVASQEELHQKFNGVVPEIAARAHVERILPVIAETLERAGIGLSDLDAIAVANEPGLAGSLLVGVVAAKALCLAHEIPLIAVNHLQAHIFACRLAAEKNVFPCVGLIVSGGHSNLYKCNTALDFTPLGGTIDDAAGEARQTMKPQFGPCEKGMSAAKWTVASGALASAFGSRAGNGGADGENHESESITATRENRWSASARGGSLQYEGCRGPHVACAQPCGSLS